MKKISKIIVSLLILTILLPVNLVKAKTKEELFFEKIEELVKVFDGSVIRDEYSIEIDWYYKTYDTNKITYDFENNIITYDSGEITTYEKAIDNMSKSLYAVYLIKAALIANGYTIEQATSFLNSDYNQTFERNGIEVMQYGTSTAYTSEDGKSTVYTQPTKVRIDITKANTTKDGDPVFTPTTTTIDKVIDTLNNIDSFKLTESDGKPFYEGEASYEESKITLSLTTYNYDYHNIFFDYDNGVISYEDGEIDDFYAAESAASHLLFGDIFVSTALKINGYTSEEIASFMSDENSKMTFENNFIELKVLGEEKTYTNDNGESYTMSPMSIKVDINNARLFTKKYEITEGANQTIGLTKDLTLKTNINNTLLNTSKVYIDDKEIASKYYEINDDTITIKNNYIKNLSIKEHTIKIVVTSGEAATTFKLIKNPQTGDNLINNIILLITSTSISLISILFIKKYLKN